MENNNILMAKVLALESDPLRSIVNNSKRGEFSLEFWDSTIENGDDKVISKSIKDSNTEVTNVDGITFIVNKNDNKEDEETEVIESAEYLLAKAILDINPDHLL
jgi:hypothetical protein